MNETNQLTETSAGLSPGAGAIRQSVNHQAELAGPLPESRKKEETLQFAVNSLKRIYDEIVEEATIEANNIRAQAEAAAEHVTERARSETAAWETEKAKLAHIQEFSAIIKLDVGGNRFTTSRATLCRCSDTMLGAMFSGRHALLQDVDGYYFIDRDGTNFRYILNFLRAPEKFKSATSPAERSEGRV